MKQCLAPRCYTETGAYFVLCKEHWRQVSLATKDEVNESFRTRQKDPEKYEIALKKAMREIHSD